MIRKFFCLILITISIISIICSIKIITMQQVSLNISLINRGFFKKAIEGDKIEDIDSIRKISIGRGWNSGELCIYRYNKPTENHWVTEGNFNFSKTIQYVGSWGRSLDIYGILGLSISLFCFCGAIIIFVKCRNEKSRVWLIILLTINFGTLLKLLQVAFT